MNSQLQLITLFIILIAFAIILIVNVVTRRRGSLALRPIPAYDDTLTLMVHESIEANRPLHLSLGSAALGDDSTMIALVGAELMYFAAQQAAISDTSPIFTISAPSSIPLAMDTLRQAYQSRHLFDRYRAINVRWYPAGPRSLAYAAVISALQGEDDISGNVFAGSFGPELVLMMDASYRRGRRALAVSDQLQGQAVAYALADETLIGEEIFAAAGYFDKTPNLFSRNISIDVLRWGLIVFVLLGVLWPVIGEPFEAILRTLVGG